MQTEPTKAEPPKRTRRWFQFSLRTLLIGVTLFAVPCAYVGWQAAIVRERKSLLEAGAGSAMFNALLDKDSDAAIPTIRRWLGDHFYRLIYVGKLADIQRYKAAFPEASVVIMPPPPAPMMPVPWKLLHTVLGQFPRAKKNQNSDSFP